MDSKIEDFEDDLDITRNYGISASLTASNFQGLFVSKTQTQG